MEIYRNIFRNLQNYYSSNGTHTRKFRALEFDPNKYDGRVGQCDGMRKFYAYEYDAPYSRWCHTPAGCPNVAYNSRIYPDYGYGGPWYE